jgi:hypothetical protein
MRTTKSILHMVFTSRNWFAMQGPVAIILISWNVIFIWETGYWTRAIKRFALFDLLKSLLHIDKKNLLTLLTSLSLYIFTIWKCIAYNFFCRDGIYFDKILVSENKLFKRSNKANLLIALKKSKMSRIFLSMRDVKIFLTFTSPNMVLLWQLFYLFCSCI